MEKKYALGLIITLSFIFLAKYWTETNSLIVGDSAVNFSYINLDGQKKELFDHTAQFTLVDFWGSWCVPCRKANDQLLDIHKKTKPEDFKIISIGIEEDQDAWQQAIAKDSLPWKDQYSSFSMFDGQIVKDYFIESTPTYFLIDREATIVAKTSDIKEIQSILVKKGILH